MFRRKFINRLKDKYRTGGEIVTTYGSKGAHLLESIGRVAPKLSTAGRFAGAAGIPLLLGDFYQRGQRLSGGKVGDPNAKSSFSGDRSWNESKANAGNFNIWNKQTGGVRKYGEGGQNEHMDLIINSGPEAWTAHQQEEHHTGGDTGSMYGPNSDNPQGPPPEWGVHFGLDPSVDYSDPANFIKLAQAGAGWGIHGTGWDKLKQQGLDKGKEALGKLTSGIQDFGSNISGLFNRGPMNFQKGGVRRQTGGMYDQMQQYQGGGRKLQERIAKSFSGSNIPARINIQLLDEALANKYLDDRISKGNYETIKKQTGGMALPGGEMEQIPGSDAVEFTGNDHDEGGIMMDPQTEVENGETMDQVTMAKKGGKRDYFFSSHLKEGGRSYADMHKEILEEGGSQEEINMLAKMQEVAAGRNPKQVAKLGGIAKYQTGGLTQKQKEENLALALQQDNTGYEEDFNELQNYTNYVKDVAPEGNMEGVLSYEEWAEMQKQVHSGPTETIDYAALDREKAAQQALFDKA